MLQHRWPLRKNKKLAVQMKYAEKTNFTQTKAEQQSIYSLIMLDK